MRTLSETAERQILAHPVNGVLDHAFHLSFATDNLVPAVWSLRTQNVLDIVQNVGEEHVKGVPLMVSWKLFYPQT